MSFDRPTSEDTEDDLLKFQREFLASGTQPAVKIVKKRKNENSSFPKNDLTKVEGSATKNRDVVKMDVEKEKELPKRVRFQVENSETPQPREENVETEMDAKDTHITAVLSKIKERNVTDIPVMFPSPRSSAFPSVFCRSGKKSDVVKEGKSKKSIFAQQFAKRSLKEYGLTSQTEQEKMQVIEPCALKPLPDAISMNRLKELYPEPGVVSGIGLSSKPKSAEFNSEESRKIHEENIQKLSTMSESEVLEEKQKLLSGLDPKLIKFLQSRSKTKPSKEEQFLSDLKEQNLEESRSKETENMDTGEQRSSEEKPPDVPAGELLTGKYLHMDVVESEKLAWTEMIPKRERKEIKVTNRFDFDGNILSGDTEIPSHLGLHHHGEDPDLPGYTLQELFILSRSNFKQQRVFAITLLGKIITKAKLGRYLDIASEPILDSLLRSGLLFLLRWSLDEQSETLLQASVFVLHSLLCSTRVEATQNMIFLSDRGCELPSLSPGVKIKDSDGDYEVAQRDIIAGLVKMTLLQRIRYILEVCKPGITTVNHCLDILIRITRHSLQSAVRVYECPRLMSFIVKNLIPIRWNMQDSGDQSQIGSSQPFPKAVALLRSLCTAGRHITSRFLNDYKDLKTVIYRYITGAEDEKNENPLSTEMEFEVWKFWILCSSFGFYTDIFTELFPIITGLIQSLTNKLSDTQKISLDEMGIVIKRSQLVFKLCNTSLAASSEKSLTQWTELSEQIQLVAITIADILIRSDDKNTNTNEFCSLLAVSLDYLAKFCEQLNSGSDILERTSYSENLCRNVLSPVFECIKCCRFSDRLSLEKTEIVPALPEMALLTDPSLLLNFQLLSSYLRCCVAVCCLNKNLCVNFCPVITHLAENFLWMSSNENLASFTLRCRTYSLYWAVNLFSLFVTNTEQDLSPFANFYYTAAFRCFGQLGSGDEHMMHNLLSFVIFNPGLIKPLIESSSSVTQTMASLDVSKHLSEMTPDPRVISESALSSLPSIRATYLSSLSISAKILEESKQRFLHRNTEIASYLLRPGSDAAFAPSDWPYIPLLQLYDQSISGHLPGGSLTHISNSLHYLSVLEQHCKDCLSSVSTTAKIVRLMCVFIAGNDIFLEPPVKLCLSFLLSRYCSVKSRQELDFSKPVPGISSFFDFYLSLLEQYEGVSYGDDLFSAVVLLPLHQLNGGIPDIKKALWCDRKEILRILSLPISKLLIPVSWYLEPIETDVFLIRAFVTAVASGYCSQHRCPVLYLIAIHHTAEFIFNKQVDVPVVQRKEICRGVMKIKQSEVQKHILHYIGPDVSDTSKTGFKYTEAMTDDRANDVNFLTR